MPTALSSPNIALIKYWGNRDNALRLPAADSLSMVLDCPTVQVTAEASDVFEVRSYDAEGKENPQSEKSVARLAAHWSLTQRYLKETGQHADLPANVRLEIRSAILPSIGIASSAAVFSALGEVYAGFLDTKISRKDVSILGRLGSGSAGRNSFGGYVALINDGEGISSAYGQQIADEKHWLLHDIVLVPSRKEKKVGSTEGHAGAATSPLFEERLKAIPRRMKECADALIKKDFEKLQRVSEEDALDMHRVMETQNPSLHYLTAETHRILAEIAELRRTEKLEVLYTMDAGPTVHLICTEGSRKAIEAYAESQKGCTVFKAKTGGASRLI